MKRLWAIALLLALALSAACEGSEEAPQSAATASPTTTPPTAEGTSTLEAGTPVAPVAALPVGKIAFSSRRDGNGEIYLLTADGEANLTRDPGEDAESDLSPDGNKIVFSSNRDGVFHIYMMNVDGSDLQRLTSEPLGDLSPRWSRDGKQIAFSRTGSLYVMDRDGANVRQVTEADGGATTAPCKSGSFVGGWSPDGKQLTFYAANLAASEGQVCIVNVDGSGLTVVVSEPPGYHVEPTWSPDGEWIAFRDIRDGNHEIYIVRPDGTSVEDLSDNPATDLEPDWSPDSQWIVFSSDRSGDFDLYIMRRDGSDVSRVTSTPGKDSESSWGP